jgi:hypothetical protein
MSLSKSAINRAGDGLVAAYNRDDELPVDESEQVAAWRTSHAMPVVWLTESVRGRTKGHHVSYRLKRLHQIVARLARADKMALARMQDIGGCPLVVEDSGRCGRCAPRSRAPSGSALRGRSRSRLQAGWEASYRLSRGSRHFAARRVPSGTSDSNAPATWLG